MRNITIRLTSNGTGRPIELGFTGENEVTQITFDCTDWLQEFGDGGLTVSAQRDGDAHPYTVILTKVDDTHYVWVLNREVDLAKAGLGIFEAEYVVDEVIKKSATYRYNVIKSMGEDTEQPEPYVAWIADAQVISAEVAQNAYNAAQSALQAQEALEEFTSITVSVNTLPAGSQATASYLDGHLTLGIPQGDKGDKGDKGETGETGNGIASVVLNSDYTLTINFTNGDSTTTTSIRGEQGERGIQGETGETGNGIQSAVLNADYTLTLTFTNGDTYTTPSIRGEKGDAGVVQDVTVNGQSVLTGNVANITIPQITKTVTGNPIVIDDADGEVKELNVELTPMQDLHGYDKPWAGGNGKNKINIGDYSASASNYYSDFRTTYKLQAGVTYTLSFDATTSVEPFSVSAGCGTENGYYIADIYTITGQTNGHVAITFTPTAAQLEGHEYFKFRPFRYSAITSYTYTISNIQFEIGSVATAYTPYENICPIYAPTTSKNKIPYPYILGSNTVNGITYTDNGDGTLTINGTATTSAFYDLGDVSRNYFELPAGTYTFAGSGNAGVGVTLCKIVNGTGQFFKNANTTAVTFTTAETASYYFYLVVNSGTTVNNLIVKPQLEEGAVATPFRPKGENVQVKQTAKNLLDPQYRSYSAQQNVRYYRNGGGGVKLYAGKTYTLSVADDNTTPAGIYMNVYGPNEASHPSVAYKYNAKSVTYTATEDVTIETDCYYVSAPAEGIENIKVQLEVSDTVTAYEPYQGEAKTITLTEPIYGGNVDVIGGQDGQVTLKLIDASTLGWSYDAGGKRWQVIVSDIYNYPARNATLWSDRYSADVTAAAGDEGKMFTVGRGVYIYSADSENAPTGQLVYPLATPTPLTTNPTPLTLYKGDNVVSSDGDVTLNYVRNLQAVIDKLENA